MKEISDAHTKINSGPSDVVLRRAKKRSELFLCTFGPGAQALGPKVINGLQGLGIKIEPNEFHREREEERERGGKKKKVLQ